MGSVHYTSPEQARGGFSDQKSDIYSIGITLYEMVTGQVPFDGDSTVSVAIKHLQEEITPPSEIVPDIPYSLEQIILKCTQKNGERRYRNTGELIQDLKRSLVDPDGDFVVIPPLGNADTVIITDEELDDTAVLMMTKRNLTSMMKMNMATKRNLTSTTKMTTSTMSMMTMRVRRKRKEGQEFR